MEANACLWRSCREMASALLIGLWLLGAGAAGAVELSDSLRATVDEMANYLQMTDSQRSDLTALVSDEAGRVRDVVDAIQDDLGFDSALDLLTETKNIRKNFIPGLRGLLDEDQKARLDRLPSDDSFYISAVARLITDARVDRFQTKLQLTDSQVPEVREVLEGGFQDALSIVAGLGRQEEDFSASLVLDIVTDLRGAQRMMDRGVRRVLTDEQKAILEEDD